MATCRVINPLGEVVATATVVADEGLTTVAPNTEVLSEQGAAPGKPVRADEALPLFAISVGRHWSVPTSGSPRPTASLRCFATHRCCTHLPPDWPERRV